MVMNAPALVETLWIVQVDDAADIEVADHQRAKARRLEVAGHEQADLCARSSVRRRWERGGRSVF